MRRFGPMLQVIGAAFLVVAVVLVFDIGGAGRAVIRHVTSRPLGGLAPGYAASSVGFKVYAAIIGAIGLVFAGMGAAETVPIAGLVAMAAGGIAFVVLSVVAVRGEVRTYRGLKL
jgi:hypothetical protein